MDGPAMRSKINLKNLDILESAILIKLISRLARFQINRETEFFGFFDSPFHQKTACAATLECWVCKE